MRRLPWRESLGRATWLAFDAGCWIIAILGTVWVGNAYAFGPPLALLPLSIAFLAGALHAVVGITWGPYLVGHTRGSFEEALGVANSTFLSGLILLCGVLTLASAQVPPFVPILGGTMAIVAMMIPRFAFRAVRARLSTRAETDRNVIIFGAGPSGRRLAEGMRHDTSSGFRPVAFVDDDRSKRKLRVAGVPVRGTCQDLPHLAQKHGASHLLVAIPQADAALLRRAREWAERAGLAVKVLPSISQMLGAGAQLRDLRDINLEDLLGRRAIELDQRAIADQIQGRVVMVTGAGGSIGSELCRQIHRYQPARLLMLDRDESALHATQLSMTGRGLLEGEDLVLADIRDQAAMRRAFTRSQPDVLFHAAALKHLSLLERHPDEAWQTNVEGTRNVLEAAAASGVGSFVNVSTDKAANPTSVLGYSKRMAERMTAHYGQTQPGRYVSVRFGNVLGSRGSVIPVFTEQIRRDGPVTITHPDVERYFMLIQEASQLVLQAAAIGADREVLVLDMGTPVRIVEVVHTLLDMAGRRDIEIQYTGLRPGEKLTEILFTQGEEIRASEHRLVSSVSVPALSPSQLNAAPRAHDASLVRWMREHATHSTSPVIR